MAQNKAQPKPTETSSDIHGRTTLVAVATCFFLSGFAALVYQAAWLKKLGIVFGTSHIAVATVLAAYMAGLAGGAALAARYSARIRRPVLVYGILEAIIGVSALLVPFLLGGAQWLLMVLYGGQPEPVAATGGAQTLYYLVATFLVLAVPTGAMGATLPLLARYAVSEDRQVGPRIGLLYGINTLGAVVGALVAGFALLPYFGLLGTLLVGAAVNVLVFLVAVYLARGETAPAPPSVELVDRPEPRWHWIMPLMLVSGAVSFALEVLWTRLLTHLFGGTVYAFSVMLACFLAGIALGGLGAGRLAANRRVAARYFVVAQILIAGLSWGSYLLMEQWIPGGLGLLGRALHAFVVIVPSTFFIGATYPLAVRLACPDAESSAGVAGRIYAWNTIGAIVGSLLAGFWLLPALGFGASLKVAMLTSLAIALVAGWLSTPRLRAEPAVAAVLLAVVVIAVHPARPERVIYAQLGEVENSGHEYFYGVGRSATVLMREVEGFINLSSNGLSESAVGRKGMPPFNLSQKWLAGLPALARPEAESMLIIGYGGGIAAEGVAPHIRDVDIVELEPMIIRANETVSGLRGFDPLNDPRITVVLNDARNAMALTGKRYDIVVSQPFSPVDRWRSAPVHAGVSSVIQTASQRRRRVSPMDQLAVY